MAKRELNIDKEALENAGVIYELFYIFYDDQKAELESSFLRQKRYKSFTEFCIEKFKEFDEAIFTS